MSSVRPVARFPNLPLHDVMIPDDPRIIVPNIRKAIVERWYEMNEANQFQGFAAPGERIIEVGSGIGFLSTVMSRDPHVAEVLCFEANPGLIDFCRDLHELNGVETVRVENAILTSDPLSREQRFFLREEFWASSIHPGPRAYSSEITMPARQLSEVIAEFSPTMIVCDIEGGEVDLFEGTELSDVRKLLIEIHTSIVGLDRVKQLFDRLSHQGFVYDQYHSNRNVVGFRRL